MSARTRPGAGGGARRQPRPGPALEARRAACYPGQVTGRHAALSIGAALLLALGVYLFLAVRVEPAGSEVVELARTPRAEAPVPPVDAPAVHTSPVAAARTSPVAVVSTPPAPAQVGALAGIAGAPAVEAMSGPKIDQVMADANKAYDHGDFDEARQIASRVLAQEPGNARMLRILVSAACLEGDAAAAQASYVKLPPADQVQMRTRCARYGITLAERP